MYQSHGHHRETSGIATLCTLITQARHTTSVLHVMRKARSELINMKLHKQANNVQNCIFQQWNPYSVLDMRKIIDDNTVCYISPFTGHANYFLLFELWFIHLVFCGYNTLHFFHTNIIQYINLAYTTDTAPYSCPWLKTVFVYIKWESWLHWGMRNFICLIYLKLSSFFCSFPKLWHQKETTTDKIAFYLRIN